MSQMPTRALLESRLQQFLSLHDSQGQQIQVKLVSIRDSAALDDSYVCYAAAFELPRDVRAEQGTYGLEFDPANHYALFMTALRPDEQGCQCLEALFHYRPTAN